MKARFQTPQIPMMSMMTMTFMPMWPPLCQSQTGIYWWFKGIYTAADALYTSLERPPPWPDPSPLTFDCAGNEKPYSYALQGGHYSSRRSCSGHLHQGWMHHKTLTYTCAQSSFLDLLILTITTLTLLWFQELSSLSRSPLMYTLRSSFLKPRLTTRTIFWLPFLDLWNIYTYLVHTVFSWSYLPGFLLHQQSPCTPDLPTDWTFSCWDTNQTNIGSFHANMSTQHNTFPHYKVWILMGRVNNILSV